MYTQIVLQLIAAIVAISAILFLIWRSLTIRKLWKQCKQASLSVWLAIGIVVVSVGVWCIATNPYPLHFAMPPTMHAYTSDHLPASVPLAKVWEFFSMANTFEKVEDIGADPTAVPTTVAYDKDGIVRFELTAKEVISEVAEGIYFNYWTYNGQVPGPMLRVKEGDTVEITLHNDPTSLHPHNIDLHSVTGPGGGATVTKVEPGETKSFQWKALNPGLYVYHCATSNVSTHNAHGQYGMILVEPQAGLSPVDHEFYVMQGELYTMGGLGKKGLTAFDSQALIDGHPTYMTFNGRVETTPRMKVQTGDRIRMYVGNGGLNEISSFHIIGEIFDTVYPEASMGADSALLHNVQTTAVLPGGATIVEFTVDVPGKYILVDHALARMNKGAWAVLQVEGEENPEVFQTIQNQ